MTSPVEAPEALAVPATIFGGAKERAAAKALPEGAFFSAEERDSMWRQGTPFWIVDAKVVKDTQYGDRARFVCVLDPATAANGEFTAENSRLLDLGLSGFRAALIEELSPILSTHKVIGPVYLAKFQTAGGQAAWDVVEQPVTDEIPY